MTSSARSVWSVCVLSLFAVACGDLRGDNIAPMPLADGGTFFYDAGSPYVGVDGGARDSGPPEVEVRRDFETPRAGARYVYVANPRRDTVAVIDSTTLAIRSVEAGDGPTYLSTVPGRDVAIVLNVGSDDATILRTTATGTVTSTLPVVHGTNALAVAPDGQHAIAWLDTSTTGAGIGTGSFQDITLLTLAPTSDTAVNLTVGFRPLEVVYSQDASAAFVVTEDGISIVRFADITSSTIVPLVPIDDGIGAYARDISITGDGRFALVRSEGESVVRLVELAGAVSTSLDVGVPITDVDLSPTGAFALAVLRDTSTLLRIPLPAGFSDPSQIVAATFTGETIGSVTITPDGRRALLYTTATPVERLIIVDLDAAAAEVPRFVRLRKGVRAVGVAPDGSTAIVVHTRIPGDPSDPTVDLDTRIDRSFGYTMLDLRSGFAKLQLTAAEVGPVALSPDGQYAFTFLRDDAASVRVLQRIALASFLVDGYTLGSPPLSLGIVPETSRAFVGQLHPEGRIGFLEWETGALVSVTGFELNGRISL
jgi:DNA-binding beta-propeller fold protein YncE